MDNLILLFDKLVIPLYKITGDPVLDYLTGTFMLAVISVLIGNLTLLMLRRVNRSHIEQLDKDLSDRHALSIEAKLSGDEAAYRVMNKSANEAFGKVFFNMFTLSAASLWPAFIVLAWMQMRFISIEFPLPVMDASVGYVFTFFILYVLARILIGNLKSTIMSYKKMRYNKNVRFIREVGNGV